MHDNQVLILTAMLTLLFGLISKRADRSPVSAPMFFVFVGIAISPLGLNLFTLEIETQTTKLIAEITLIIILFVDASFIKLSDMRQRLKGLPARLLLIGLPLTMILGSAIAALLYPDTSIWLLCVLALILSPTDAALGQAVVKSPDVPLQVRESISVESGLNDGISLPLILVCMAVVASGNSAIAHDGYWLSFMAKQLTLGPIIGIIVGFVGGKMVEYAHKKDWMEIVFQRLVSISLALLAYSFAEMVGGNGFIAAFFSGLFLAVKNNHVRERIQEFGETEGQMLTLFVFLIFGLFAIPSFYPYWDVKALCYAVLSLTLIRIIPVFVCLLGTGLDNYSKLFIAWFGPRGIASILYLMIAIDEIGTTGHEAILSIIVLTVLLSIFAHGITAVSMSKAFKNNTFKK